MIKAVQATSEIASPPLSSGEQRRAEITILAYSTIAEKGFEGLRVREVATRAGINVATLHYYFPTKEDLIKAVVQYLTEQFATARANPLAATATDPLVLLREEFGNLKYRLQKLPQLLIVAAELELRALRDPAISSIMEGMFRAWREHLVSLLQRGVAQGLFKSDLDINTSATVIMTIIKGFSYPTTSEAEQEVDRLAAQVESWLRAG
jgi:AcrR family transcriptional regulator